MHAQPDALMSMARGLSSSISQHNPPTAAKAAPRSIRERLMRVERRYCLPENLLPQESAFSEE